MAKAPKAAKPADAVKAADAEKPAADAAKAADAKADDAEKADAKATASKPKTVKMHREHDDEYHGPTTADVHVDEVANWSAAGWNRS